VFERIGAPGANDFTFTLTARAKAQGKEVWAFIADPANNPKWDPGTLAVRRTSADLNGEAPRDFCSVARPLGRSTTRAVFPGSSSSADPPT